MPVNPISAPSVRAASFASTATAPAGQPSAPGLFSQDTFVPSTPAAAAKPASGDSKAQQPRGHDDIMRSWIMSAANQVKDEWTNMLKLIFKDVAGWLG